MPPEADAPAVLLERLTVRYAVPREMVSTLKEYAIRKLVRRIENDQLVALRDVDLVVRKGERVGVIGANGAGKSTLFRVIARVRRPSSGRVVVEGRVAPLLEMGLGMQGELTGRENVVLQGTLLGFSRAEMLERMDRIAAFAELEAFLDAPIRTYSTGMAARLAFSVATDVEPDILLVDEALAVGDERFQRRCHERMEGLRERGRTILLVSHSPQEILANCQRALWIGDGRIVRDGPAPEVCAAYHEWAASGAAVLPEGVAATAG
ncbi:MAG: ABC transporter ATP-binding protein [Thermoanaerobaculia bacterium]